MNREVMSKCEPYSRRTWSELMRDPGCITVGETPFTHHDFDVLVPYVLPENKE